MASVAENVYEWEKKENTPNTLSMTEEPNPTLTNNTTSPATTIGLQQHRDEGSSHVPDMQHRRVLRSQKVQKSHTCPVLGQSRGRSRCEKTLRTQRSSYVVQFTVYEVC